MGQLNRALRVYKKEGSITLMYYIISFLKCYVFMHAHILYLTIKYRRLPLGLRDEIFISPSDIRYSISARNEPDTRLAYGVIGGEWDKKKVDFWSGTLRPGLWERYAEQKPWPETVYYQESINKIQKGEKLARIDDREQTLDGIEQYLLELDILYEAIRNNGYESNSHITVCIGRYGEIMVHTGNHRSAIAKILDLNEIPAFVTYRHTNWQKIREKFRNYDSVKDVPEDLRDFIDHPDIPDIH